MRITINGKPVKNAGKPKQALKLAEKHKYTHTREGMAKFWREKGQVSKFVYITTPIFETWF